MRDWKRWPDLVFAYTLPADFVRAAGGAVAASCRTGSGNEGQAVEAQAESHEHEYLNVHCRKIIIIATRLN